MRFFRYGIFLSALLIAAGVFLPYVELGVGGISFGKRTSMPLYNAVSNYTFLERVSERVDASVSVRIADGLLAQLALSTPGRLSQKVRDIQETIAEIKDAKKQERLETIGSVLRIIGILFLVILGLIAWLVTKSLSRTGINRRRGRWIAFWVSVVSVVSIALFIVVREAINEGNAELRHASLSLGMGAYLMFIGAVLGIVAAMVCLKLEHNSNPLEHSQSEV